MISCGSIASARAGRTTTSGQRHQQHVHTNRLKLTEGSLFEGGAPRGFETLAFGFVSPSFCHLS